MGAADKTIALLDRSAACFRDGRSPELIEHSIETLVRQRLWVWDSNKSRRLA
jgi:hypothetical protein